MPRNCNTMAEALSVLHKPRMSRAGFMAVLENENSPAAPVGGPCFDAIAAQGVDPAVGLAFFKHESSFGKAGAAVSRHNWGNLRPGTWAISRGLADGQLGNFLLFRDRETEMPGWSWVRSAGCWAILIREFYCEKWDKQTVEDIVPKYAPAADGNAPTAYIADIVDTVATWAQKYPPDSATIEPTAPPAGPDGAIWVLAKEVGDLVRRLTEVEARLVLLERRLPPEPPGVSP